MYFNTFRLSVNLGFSSASSRLLYEERLSLVGPSWQPLPLMAFSRPLCEKPGWYDNFKRLVAVVNPIDQILVNAAQRLAGSNTMDCRHQSCVQYNYIVRNNGYAHGLGS